MVINQGHPTTWLGDAISAGAIIGAIVGWLPIAAAVAGFVWYCIQIYESKTTQDAVNAWLSWRRSRRIKKLRQAVSRITRIHDEKIKKLTQAAEALEQEETE